MNTVTVIIVTYESAPLLKACLESIATGMEGIDAYGIVVVDNASTDGWRAEVEATCKDATLVELDSNRGYAAGINAGVGASKPSEAFLVLNPDVRLEPGSVRSLLTALGEPGTGIAVPRLVDAEGRLQQSLRRRPTTLRAFGEALLGGSMASRISALGEVVSAPSAYERPGTHDWATGAAMLISRECFEAVGSWDESFFLYSEETDFQLRAADLGYSVRYEPGAVMRHLGGESRTSPELWALLARNRVRLHRRRHGWARASLFWVAVALNEAVRAAGGSSTHRAALSGLLGLRRQSRLKPSQGIDPGREPAFICFSAQDWWYHNRAHSDFQLMREIAKSRRVLLVNSITMRMPLPGRSTQVLRRVSRKLRSVAKYVRQPDPDLPNFWVMTPLFLPFYGRAWSRWLNGRLVRFQVSAVARFLAIVDPICFVTIPTAWEVVRDLERRMLVYNRSDLHSAFEEANADLIRSLERALMANADRVLYVSRELMAVDAKLTVDKAVFLDHGVDLDHFRRRSPAEEPHELAAVPHPRMGFFGALDSYTVDFDLLEQLARTIPEANLVLVGDASVPMTKLLALPNVAWFGFRSYDEIPRYGSGFDVALMPWRRDEWIRYCNPIKLKEYLALGLPVVTSDFPEAHHYRRWITIASDRDDFVDKVRTALVEGDAVTPAERRAAVADASWSSRAQRLLDSCRDGA